MISGARYHRVATYSVIKLVSASRSDSVTVNYIVRSLTFLGSVDRARQPKVADYQRWIQVQKRLSCYQLTFEIAIAVEEKIGRLEIAMNHISRV